MFDILRFGNNAQQVVKYRVVASEDFLNGGVAGGTGTQVFIPRNLSGRYIEKIGIEPLFVPATKVKAP